MTGLLPEIAAILEARTHLVSLARQREGGSIAACMQGRTKVGT